MIIRQKIIDFLFFFKSDSLIIRNILETILRFYVDIWAEKVKSSFTNPCSRECALFRRFRRFPKFTSDT